MENGNLPPWLKPEQLDRELGEAEERHIDIAELTEEQEALLREEHVKDYSGLDDEMPDDFEMWLELLSQEELLEILNRKI